MLTPQKAADKAGVSRKTIMDAITAGKINAKRDNRNRWQIEEPDLQRWMDSREIRPQPKPISDTNTVRSVEVAVLEERLLSSEKQITIYLQQLEDAKAEKARLLTLLEDAQRKRGWMEVLFGRAGR